jgi:hypothetical protein
MSDKTLYEKRRSHYAEGSTTERLRIDIDSGKTGDKIPVADPAAAPLGTDEEAAGTPVDPRVVEAVRQEELRRGLRTKPENAQIHPLSPNKASS